MSRVELVETIKQFAEGILEKDVDIYIAVSGHVWLRINKPFGETESYLLGNSGESFYAVCNGKEKPSTLAELKAAVLKLKEE